MRWVIIAILLLILLGSASAISSANMNTGEKAQYIEGVDVSHWQGDIDWNQVYQDGYRFAFVKATEGTNYVDSKFEDNMNNGSSAGLYMGAYHFAHPDSNSANNEADFFISVITPYLKNGYLVPVLDLEDGSSLGKSALSQWVNDFMNRIYEKTGLTGIVYTNSNYANNYLDSSVTQWPLWIANYGVSEPNTGVWNSWYFWQYDDKGSVSGISGDVDLDHYNGDVQSLYDNFVIHENKPVSLTYYDRKAAVGYASKWWNSRNPHYNDYSSSGGDCADFVSQALIAGGLSLWRGYDGEGGGVYSDSNGTIPYCDYLHDNLVKYQDTKFAYVTSSNFTVPDWLEVGDVIIFGDASGDHWKHATIVVYRNGNEVGVAAHTADVWNKSISDYFPSEFDRINYYHINDGKKNMTTIFSVTASALNVRVGPSTDYQVIGTISDGEKYVAFDSYTDSQGHKWWKFFYDDRVAWCASWYTEEISGEIVMINVTSWLNVRSGPGTSYKIVGEAYHGMLFAKVGSQYNSSEGRTWYEIYYSSSVNWIAGEYTSNVPEFNLFLFYIVIALGIITKLRRKKSS